MFFESKVMTSNLSWRKIKFNIINFCCIFSHLALSESMTKGDCMSCYVLNISYMMSSMGSSTRYPTDWLFCVLFLMWQSFRDLIVSLHCKSKYLCPFAFIFFWTSFLLRFKGFLNCSNHKYIYTAQIFFCCFSHRCHLKV